MIKTIYFMFFVFAMWLGMAACGGKEKDSFKNLSADEFERKIQDDNIQLVDVRTVAEYSKGHIPGSLNINVLDEKFTAYAEEVLDTARPVAVYCKSGKRSRRAAKLLTMKGFKIVYNLDKGYESWKEAGKQTEL